MKRRKSVDIPAGKSRKARDRRTNLRHEDKHTADAAAAGRTMIIGYRGGFGFSGGLGRGLLAAATMMRATHF
jgi:hypothetical protein